ncbi:uncharacterized protein LOC124163884 isoform X2 [Ischnura elegans]|uniref:uncharacterized protein LOC124163884 isoform X2 n=1 Tax=Ischnura elegans TaxID=197161 RepID=UPI001ED8789B|nr:uncharacterized protein LOC124163884 isoform X2 [Ischnura elegans]
MEMYFFDLLLFTAFFSSSLQKDGDTGNLKKECHAPESYANTICSLDSNDINLTFPVPSETKVHCFCSYNGNNVTDKLIPLKNGRNVTLICQDNGTWSSDPPICYHSITEKLNDPMEVQAVFTATNQSVTFTRENMTLFPIFASGSSCFTLYGTKNEDEKFTQYLGEKSEWTRSTDLSHQGLPFSMDHWNPNTLKSNMDALKDVGYNIKVLLNQKDHDQWNIFKSSSSCSNNNSSSKEIVLKVKFDRKAVIYVTRLELLWDFEISSMTINGKGIKSSIFQLQWDRSSLPQVIVPFEEGRNISTFEIQIISLVKRYEWPLSGIFLQGENDTLITCTNEEVNICPTQSYCETLEAFKKQGRHFPRKYFAIKVNFTCKIEHLVHKIIFGFYDHFDVKMKTATKDIQGIHMVTNKNIFIIEFPHPEPVIVSSEYEFTLESSVKETWNWPVKEIQFEQQRGHPDDWCNSLKNITKVITTVDRCYHFAGEGPRWTSKSATKVRVNYSDAANHCALINGSLAEPRNKAIQDLLASESEDFQFFRIGVERQNNSEKWQWKSGDYLAESETYFVNCSRDEPVCYNSKSCIESEKENCEAAENENCVVLQREYNYKWMPRSCQEETKYICQSAYIGCGIPHKNEIAIMTLKEDSYGFPLKVQYECPEGFYLDGVATRACSDGVWSYKAPTCKEETSSAPEIAAISIIVICTTASVIIITVSIILCWKRRGSTRKPNDSGPEVFDEQETSQDTKNSLADKSITKSNVEPSFIIKMNQPGNISLGNLKVRQASSSRPQQVMEMVESDIYDSYDPKNISVENDIYGSM